MTEALDLDRPAQPIAALDTLRSVVAGYEACTAPALETEISDDFMGETGDLVREHAQLIVGVRWLIAELAATQAELERLTDVLRARVAALTAVEASS